LTADLLDVSQEWLAEAFALLHKAGSLHAILKVEHPSVLDKLTLVRMQEVEELLRRDRQSAASAQAHRQLQYDLKDRILLQMDYL